MSLIKKGSVHFLENYGVLQIDKYGLSTATAQYFDHGTTPTVPSLNASHPLWNNLLSEKITVTHLQTHWQIEVNYAGLIGSPTPVYELDLGTAQEPIETHPEFLEFAGTPAAPLHGAVFDSEGQFVNFVDVANFPEFAGVRDYLAPGAVWRENLVSTSAPDSGLANLGIVNSPSGPAPSAGGTRNWLYTGMTFEKRGGAYTIHKEWRLSGPRGWNTTIYA